MHSVETFLLRYFNHDYLMKAQGLSFGLCCSAPDLTCSIIQQAGEE